MTHAQGTTNETDSQRKAWRLFVRWFWIPLALIQLVALLWDIPILGTPPLPSSVGTTRKIGEIKETQNEVRIQRPQDVAWERAASPSHLISGSRILTFDRSTARLELEQVGDLQIRENTLIVIEEPRSQNEIPFLGKLKLLRGNFKFHLKDGVKPLSIQLGSGSPIELQPGAEIEAQKSEGSDEAKITVLKGNVKTTGSDIQSISAGQSIEWKGAGAQSITSQSAAPESAKPEPTRAPLRLQAPKLKTPKFRPSTHPKKETSSLPLRPDKKSAHLSRTLIEAFTSLLWIPSANAEEALASTSPYQEMDIDLEWEEVPGAQIYRVQIARDRSFKTIIFDEKSPTTSLTWHYKPGMENSKGRVFYRVSAQSKEASISEFSAPGVLWIPKPNIEKKTVLVKTEPTPIPENKEPAFSSVQPVRPFWSQGERLKIFLEVGASVSSLNQTSSTRMLREVDGGSPFVHEWLRIRFLPFEKIESSLEFRSIKWKSDSTTHSTQPDLTVYTGQVRILRTIHPRYSLGGSITQNYRFEKTSRRTIEASSAFSVAPALVWRRNKTEASIQLPLLGFLMESYYGLDLRLSHAIPTGAFHIIPEAGYSLSKWKTPESTEVKQWFFAASLGISI